MSHADAAIAVRDLQMSYGTKTVLDGVSFEVARGEVVVLLGPNGAGKTTTIEILEGFRERSGGDVEVLGYDPAHASHEWRSRIGLVLQSWRDHARWTPRMLLHHLGDFYVPYASDTAPRPRDVDQLIDDVGLTPFADQKIRTLSGGQRRRLDVAVGIVGNPELVFFDEPTAGLDPHGRREFHDMVHRLADYDNTTIVLTTHDLDEAEKLADRIMILAGGTIVANGTADALAREVAKESEVRWRHDGTVHVHATADPTGFVRTLFADGGPGITELEVSRASLEDTYIEMVRKYESAATEPVTAGKE